MCGSAGNAILVVPTRGTFSEWDMSDPKSLYIARRHRDRRGVLHLESPWSNPFRVRDYPDVETCLSKYRAHLANMKAYPSCLKVLSGLRLICHCALNKKCQADVLISSFSKGLEGDFVAKVGVLRTSSEQVQEATGITHPFSTLAADDNVKIAVTRTLKMGPTAVKEHRRFTLEVEEAC